MITTKSTKDTKESGKSSAPGLGGLSVFRVCEWRCKEMLTQGHQIHESPSFLGDLGALGGDPFFDVP